VQADLKLRATNLSQFSQFNSSLATFLITSKLLCDEAFQFAEGLLLKNDPYLFLFGGYALAENQLSNFFCLFGQAQEAVSSESAAEKCRTP